MRLALPLGELEHVQRPLDVHLVRPDWSELGACGQKRCQMENAIDFELGQHAIEQTPVGYRADVFARDEGCQRRVERVDVERDDRPTVRRKARDERMTDFAACACDEDDWFTHAWS